MSKKPRNEDAIDLLLRAMATGNSSDAILQQEADGQSSFTKSETLPSDMSEEARKALEKSGVKFLGIVEDDPIFQYVELPEGWKKIPTSHSMWSDLIDANGKKRAGIFYKAASYDRSANLSIVKRFNIQIDYERLREEDLVQAKVFDNNEEIFSSEPVPFPVPYKDVSVPRKRYEAEDEAKAKAIKEAEEWLEEKYPEWKDPSMYWND